MRYALLAFAVALAARMNASSYAGSHPHLRIELDTTAAARDRMAQIMLDSLGSRGSEPAESIWPDLKTGLRRVPARNLIAIMNLGYGRSLGVTCNFCHVPGHYEREDSAWKQVARDMAAMAARINQELLASIPNLKCPNPIINCTTCHRGQVKPALNLDSARTN
jgi:hypothetical protein